MQVGGVEEMRIIEMYTDISGSLLYRSCLRKPASHRQFWNLCGLQILVSVRTGHGTTDTFQIEKGVRQGCILSPCLFNLYAEYMMRNAGLEEAQL